METAACSVHGETGAAATVTIIFLAIFVLLIFLDGVLTFIAVRECILANKAPDGAKPAKQKGSGVAVMTAAHLSRELSLQQLYPRRVA